ncbi:MAG TPA: hypothetical protein VF587_11965 [Solirubrobacteraceae bacterium]
MDERAGERRPAVECTSCHFAWHSARMAEGLRLLGSCPRCGGALAFPDPVAPPAEAAAEPGGEPHLVLGLPRPPDR